MRKATYLAITGIAMAQFALAQNSFKVRSQETKRNGTETTESRLERDQRVKTQISNRQAGLQAESTNQMVNFLSAVTRGQTDSTQLKAGLAREYQVQAIDSKSNSSRMVIVKVGELAQKISLESQKIKETNDNALVGEQFTAFNARKTMVDLAAKLVGVASKKYAGTDANLVVARDAFARLVETSTKVMDSNSGATSREISEHNRIINEVIKAKESNDSLSDAEAMLLGARRAQELMASDFAKETGITNNESAEAKEARVREYLKDLKDCT
jgi:hypothetical protein